VKTAIIGTGAIGCLMGGMLKEGGHDVILIGRNETTVAAINRQGGARIDDSRGSRLVAVSATLDHRFVDRADLVILAVKAYDTREALQEIRSALGPETPLLTPQNGLGNIEAADEILGPGRLIAGTTSHGSNVVAPGHIRHAGSGETLIGETAGALSDRARQIAQVFSAAGLQTEAVKNVVGYVWLKVIVNAVINPLTALLRVKNGALVQMPGLSAIMRGVAEEGLQVAKAAGVRLPCDDPYAKAADVCKATAENVSSMLQDVLQRRRTEIDQINGALADRAEKAGIAAIYNRSLHSLITALDSLRDRPGRI
jgi:2-dehydropantoate 2-reductase